MGTTRRCPLIRIDTAHSFVETCGNHRNELIEKDEMSSANEYETRHFGRDDVKPVTSHAVLFSFSMREQCGRH
ncbi:hypothetical protein B296_00049974 [Ensete ventricosum]|uniref:Uncharacterized protein n=1 Tax=Ensete ventricosum TaxID=4639 RepID=A0A426XA55_ENSVE|nr:hypothetical protein B296_00049974 [Ensete ventricosum]